jgi:hypothetical protein
MNSLVESNDIITANCSFVTSYPSLVKFPASENVALYAMLYQDIEVILKNIGILEYIDILISNNDTINKKPHSEPYIRAMLKFNGNLEDYIIFEDSECGLLSARGTGCRVLHVKHPDEINIKLLSNI